MAFGGSLIGGLVSVFGVIGEDVSGSFEVKI